MSNNNVGEVFRLIVPKADGKGAVDLHRGLHEVARIASFAENSAFMLWRQHDPLGPLDVIERDRIKEETGKYTPLPEYELDRREDMESAYKQIATLMPGLYSDLPCAIARHVRAKYTKWRTRLGYLRFTERLPICKDPRIRVRGQNRSVTIRSHPTNPDWFDAELKLRLGETWRVGLNTRGKSPYTLRWLGELAEGTRTTSAGTISLKRSKRKAHWQLFLSRPRYADECAAVEPIPGRTMTVYAPPDQDVFLECDIGPVDGRPWRFAVESSGYEAMKRVAEKRRRAMGVNWRQSPGSAAHGHGRKRAIEKRKALGEAEERRKHAYVETRSRWIVNDGIKHRVECIAMEDLSKRNPNYLRLGQFPYARLVSRVEEKARQAGIKFKLIKDLETVRTALSIGKDGTCAA